MLSLTIFVSPCISSLIVYIIFNIVVLVFLKTSAACVVVVFACRMQAVAFIMSGEEFYFASHFII